jgi:hypothetical protein
MDTSQPPLGGATTRPAVITFICVIMLLGALISIPGIFLEAARSIGAWYPPFLALSCLVGCLCLVGLWKMRRWAVFTYAAFCAFNQIVLLAMGRWSVVALVIPGIVIGVMFLHFSKMR